MLRILLLGASGLVGRETLRLALGRGDVDGVIAPTRDARKTAPFSHT